MSRLVLDEIWKCVNNTCAEPRKHQMVGASSDSVANNTLPCTNRKLQDRRVSKGSLEGLNDR